MEARIQNPEWILSLGRGFSFLSTAVETSANKEDFDLSGYHKFIRKRTPILSQIK